MRVEKIASYHAYDPDPGEHVESELKDEQVESQLEPELDPSIQTTEPAVGMGEEGIGEGYAVGDIGDGLVVGDTVVEGVGTTVGGSVELGPMDDDGEGAPAGLRVGCAEEEILGNIVDGEMVGIVLDGRHEVGFIVNALEGLQVGPSLGKVEGE